MTKSIPVTMGSAPGKVILFGEHAVVYGYPAIAVPVIETQAQARITPGAPGQGTIVAAPDLDRQFALREAPLDDPLAFIVRQTLETMGQDMNPDVTIAISSSVPIARGMGSGAAVSTAIVRGLGKHFGHWFSSQAISDLVFQVEKIYHGSPSGIDNSVVAFEKPVYFVKDKVCEVFWVGKPLLLAIADTGIESSTRKVVGDLRERYRQDPGRYEPLFQRAGEIANEARSAIAQGNPRTLGDLMNENHSLLQGMGVSCPALDRLVQAAREGGALGAKLSGAGWGGNMIALVTEATRGRVDMMLRLAGATDIIVTKVR